MNPNEEETTKMPSVVTTVVSRQTMSIQASRMLGKRVRVRRPHSSLVIKRIILDLPGIRPDADRELQILGGDRVPVLH